jgi:hypothetical protein
MSKTVKGITHIREMVILKKTLTEMNISFKELSEEKIAFGQGYDRVTIDTSNGDVHYDEMRKSFIDNLQQGYSKNLILAEILKKGHKVESVKTVGQNIEIIAGY